MLKRESEGASAFMVVGGQRMRYLWLLRAPPTSFLTLQHCVFPEVRLAGSPERNGRPTDLPLTRTRVSQLIQVGLTGLSRILNCYGSDDRIGMVVPGRAVSRQLGRGRLWTHWLLGGRAFEDSGDHHLVFWKHRLHLFVAQLQNRRPQDRRGIFRHCFC